jgi:hypothetical protein
MARNLELPAWKRKSGAGLALADVRAETIVIELSSQAMPSLFLLVVC